jgi:hypothetical protein
VISASSTCRKKSFLTVDVMSSLMNALMLMLRNSASRASIPILFGLRGSSVVHSRLLQDESEFRFIRFHVSGLTL